MQLSSSEPCVVILTEKEVEVSVNNHATFTLPKNYLAAFACNNNVIELSTLNHVLITHINRNIINDYLLFLNKNLTCVKPWSRLATPVIACHSRTPEVFRLAANHSKQQPSKPCEAELTRVLLFTVLSNFLEQSRFSISYAAASATASAALFKAIFSITGICELSPVRYV